MLRTICIIFFLLELMTCTFAAEAPAPAQPAPAQVPDPAAFSAKKFGIFINWGIADILGKGQNVLATDHIPLATYEKLQDQFNPEKFDAAALAQAFKAAGARYVTIAAKRSDGFCLFDSSFTRFNVMNTPFERDVLKELVDACRAAGLDVHLYYSLTDWHHSGYWPWGFSGTMIPGRPTFGNNARYLQYYQDQLCELLVKYGKVEALCLDGESDRSPELFDLPKTYEMMHKLQPQMLLASNSHRSPAAAGDYRIFSAFWPLDRFQEQAVPAEYWQTINNSPGYSKADENDKSARELLRELVTLAGKGGNLLLSPDITPAGTLVPQHAEVLRQMGIWLTAHGFTIFDTSRGPWTPRPWGVSTQKANRAWLHIISRPGQTLRLTSPPVKLLSAKGPDGTAIEFEQNDDPVFDKELKLALPEWDDNTVIDYIVELSFANALPPLWIPEKIKPDIGGNLELTAENAELQGNDFFWRGGWMWSSPESSLTWYVQLPQSGKYRIRLTGSCPQPPQGSIITIAGEQSQISANLRGITDTWTADRSALMPEAIELPTGNSTVTLKVSAKETGPYIKFISIQLELLKEEIVPENK